MFTNVVNVIVIVNVKRSLSRYAVITKKKGMSIIVNVIVIVNEKKGATAVAPNAKNPLRKREII